MNKNTKIAIGLVALAGLFLAYKKGLFSKKISSDSGESTDNSTPNIPIVETASSSSSPQVVVDQKPQFTETVSANVPSIPGSYQSYAN